VVVVAVFWPFVELLMGQNCDIIARAEGSALSDVTPLSSTAAGPLKNKVDPLLPWNVFIPRAVDAESSVLRGKDNVDIGVPESDAGLFAFVGDDGFEKSSTSAFNSCLACEGRFTRMHSGAGCMLRLLGEGEAASSGFCK
jgi:hypothetical protein